MPLGILALLGTPPGPTPLSDGLSSLTNFTYLGLIVLLICTFWGLVGRSGWGYALNWCVLVVECLLFPLTRHDRFAVPLNFFGYLVLFHKYFLLAGLAFVFWFLPNAVYFRKRRHLFGPPMVEEKNIEENEDNRYNVIIGIEVESPLPSKDVEDRICFCLSEKCFVPKQYKESSLELIFYRKK